jgi:hypothetical protein
VTALSVALVLAGLVLLAINFPATLDALSDRSRRPPTRMIVLFLVGLGCLFVGFAV